MSGGDPRFKYTSYYKDTTLFYNFYTDTVFTVYPHFPDASLGGGVR